MLLEPRGKGILATTLRYNYEVRDDDAYLDEVPDVKIPKEMLDLAKHIIKTKAGLFEPAQFEDRYETALIEFLRAKQGGRKPPERKMERPSNVVNLMDALRRSINAGQGGKAGEASRKQQAKRRGSTPSRAKAEPKPKRPRHAAGAKA